MAYLDIPLATARPKSCDTPGVASFTGLAIRPKVAITPARVNMKKKVTQGAEVCCM
jgi:hypothetical protein